MSTDAKARRKPPFAVMATSVKGVYSFVPPPKGVDLTKASPRTLLKHGVLMRRPDPDRESKLFALWSKFVTDVWTEENFVPPVFGAPDTITHNLKGTVSRLANGTYNSGGWSGVVVVGKWVGAMGIWQVPKVSAPTTPVGQSGVYQSSSWVGLDGAKGLIPGTTTTDVLQTGVSHNVIASTGQAVYYAWFEWVVANYAAVAADFPYVYPIIIKSPTVKAGDEICAIVQYVYDQGDDIANPIPPPGPYNFGGLMLTNVTTGKPIVNLYLEPPTGASFAGESAEWIMECPDGLARDTLPKFSSVNFHSAGACNVGDAPPGGDVGVELQNADRVTFEDFEGNVETNVNAGLATVSINYQ